MSLSTGNNTKQKANIVSGFQEDLAQLRSVPLFRGLDYECLKILAMLCRRVTLVADDQLMVEGEDDGCAFVILSGNVKACRTVGTSTRIICQFGAGDFIGGSALLGKSPRLFTVQATEETETLQLNREELQKVLEQFPEAVSKITGNLLSEITAWDRNLLEGDDWNPETIGVSLI